MPNNQRRRERKAEIAVVRQEGFDAAMAGKHVQTNPYNPFATMDHWQWLTGYGEGEEARRKIMQIAEEREAMAKKNFMLDEYDNTIAVHLWIGHGQVIKLRPGWLVNGDVVQGADDNNFLTTIRLDCILAVAQRQPDEV